MTSKAQQYSKGYLDSVKEFYRQWSENTERFTNPVILNNTSDPAIVGRYLSRIKPKKLIIRDGKSDSLIITKKELSYVLQRIKESEKFTWDDNFFKGSKIIDTAELSLMKVGCLRENKCAIQWVFSLPAFLRNNTYAVIYSEWFTFKGSGEGALIFFKNENGKWSKVGKAEEILY